MNIKSTPIGRHVIEQLCRLTGTPFQHRCYTYLSRVFPTAIDALPLKTVDRYGLDIYTLSSKKEWDFKLGFQCKGFETRFEQSQFDQCLKSLRALRDSGKKVQQFFLVINLKNQHFNLRLRKELESNLAQLKSEQIVASANLLEAESFTEYLSEQIINQLYQKIQNANRRFSEDYLETMHQQFYFTEVPFRERGSMHSDPGEFITNVIKKKSESMHPDKKMQFFVISEFGFGKTSLMFQLFRMIRGSYRCLYIPIALFDQRALEHTTTFYERMLEIIEGHPIDFSDPLEKLSAKLLQYLLQYKNNKNVLLLDGLDENEHLYQLNSLKNLMSSLNFLTARVVIGVRKEMWDERNGNFSIVLGARPTHKEIILSEWRNQDILYYLEIYASGKNNLSEPLQEFYELVEEDRYKAFYGDIPKRPLFLEMIIADVSQNGIRRRNMSELYFDFFEKKFSIDRQGSFSKFSTNRPGNVKEDAYYMLSLYFTILSRIAVRMAVGIDEQKNMIVRNYIEEEQLKAIMRELGVTSTMEIALNSVLIPSGVRTKSGLILKFAHRSFQEFFFARGINNHLLYQLDKNESWEHLDAIHSDDVNRFLLGFLDTEFPAEKKVLLKKRLKETYPILKQTSLASLIIKHIN